LSHIIAEALDDLDIPMCTALPQSVLILELKTMASLHELIHANRVAESC
jgi:hypothetical protein